MSVDAVSAKLPNGAQISMGNPARCHVAQELYWHEGQLASVQDQHALRAALLLARTAALFLDVGSYSGLFAIGAARVNPELQAYAYEIVGENYMLIHENVLRNDVADRVHPQLCALGAATGEMRTPFELGYGVLASSVALDWEFETGLRIPVRRLDDLFPGSAGSIAMKIDVEGFEMEVFDGAQAFLEMHRPDMICEVLRRAKRVDEMEEMLRRLGYRWLHITESGFEPKPRIVADKLRRDWLFTTRSDTELIELGLVVATE